MTPSTATARENIERLVREVIASILPHVPAESVSGDKSLKDHGADSVDRVEIIVSIMNRLGIDEPMSNFNNIPNINELVNYLWKAQRR
jgi:polyketide biosynthesis acyl carrier protein